MDASSSVWNLVAHPQWLSAAWIRVEAWYAGGEWAPEPEVSHWLLDPDGELARLSAEIR